MSPFCVRSVSHQALHSGNIHRYCRRSRKFPHRVQLFCYTSTANIYNSSMASSPRFDNPNPQLSMGWGRPDMQLAIRCIRQIHRNGQVLNLWDLARLIHRENERTSSSRKEITVMVVHQKLVDIFECFESCRQLSCGWDPIQHNRITPLTRPNTIRGAILHRFGWYYEFLAVLGKSNTTRLIF